MTNIQQELFKSQLRDIIAASFMFSRDEDLVKLKCGTIAEFSDNLSNVIMESLGRMEPRLLKELSREREIK